MAMALARGWALAITDYQGLGTPGDHTYMVGRALGPNVIDSMRAARELSPEALPADGPAAIIGYSEGGAAAAWAAQLQPSYAPDVALVAVVAGAAAANVEIAGPSLDGTFFSFFIAYGGIGFAAAYPELDLDSYLTPAARKRIGALRESTIVQALLWGPKFMRSSELTEPNVLELPEWQRRLRENRLGLIAPRRPVLLHHARRDQIVSFDHSVNLHDDWRALGGDVRLYVTRGGVDHISGAVAGTPVALDWISRRFGRGAAAPAAGRDRGRGHRRGPRPRSRLAMGFMTSAVADGVTVMTIDRPPANAMNVELLAEIGEVLRPLAAQPPRALVIAGRDGVFSAGADLKAVPGYGSEDQRRMVTGINEMVILAYGLPCPVIGAITGHAIAGGLVLALCADYRIASDAGRYGLTEVKVAVPYPQAAIEVVRAELGPAAARVLALRSELTDAADCLRLGVFDEVVGAGDVLSRAMSVAAEMAALPADVYARTKRDLRGAALAAMRAGADADPLLGSWV